MTQRKLFNKRDIWIFAGLALLAFLAYASRRGEPDSDVGFLAQVTVGRQVVWSAPLSAGEGAAFVPDQTNVRLLVINGAAGFVCSDCPDQICVRSGFISQPGQMAVCLPNRVSLLIVSERRPPVGTADTFAY